MDRMTFDEWFKREYPLFEREGRDTSLKHQLQAAWDAALESVRSEAPVAWAIYHPDGKLDFVTPYNPGDTHGLKIKVPLCRALSPARMAEGGGAAPKEKS